MHQRLAIWKEDGVLENIEADQSYFLAEVDTITKKTFDKQLAKIAPCAASKLGYEDQDNFLWSLKLHHKDGFTWEKEITNEGSVLRTRASTYSKASIWGRPGVPPTGWPKLKKKRLWKLRSNMKNTLKMSMIIFNRVRWKTIG
jgi:hypothetical protein